MFLTYPCYFSLTFYFYLECSFCEILYKDSDFFFLHSQQGILCQALNNLSLRHASDISHFLTYLTTCIFSPSSLSSCGRLGFLESHSLLPVTYT